MRLESRTLLPPRISRAKSLRKRNGLPLLVPTAGPRDKISSVTAYLRLADRSRLLTTPPSLAAPRHPFWLSGSADGHKNNTATAKCNFDEFRKFLLVRGETAGRISAVTFTL